MAYHFPQAIEDITSALTMLPGIGRRTAERLSLALSEWDEQRLSEFGTRIAELKSQIRNCRICGTLSDSEICSICNDESRDHQLLCIVEHARQVPIVLKSGRFNGIFHVLGGRVSPLDGISVADLNVSTLYSRVNDQQIEEVLISTSPDVEGQATASYLATELRNHCHVRVSRIALGVPVGSDLSYADPDTIGMAIDARRDMPE